MAQGQPRSVPTSAPPPAVASVFELLGTGVALLLLLALMIAASRIGLSSGWRALIILVALAGQAVLIGLFLMGLRRDSGFHALVVVVSLLVVLAFAAFTTMDAGQTQPRVIWQQAVPAVVPP